MPGRMKPGRARGSAGRSQAEVVGQAEGVEGDDGQADAGAVAEGDDVEPAVAVGVDQGQVGVDDPGADVRFVAGPILGHRGCLITPRFARLLVIVLM